MEILPTALDPVVLGRWQFGITTVYHFILVPLTIGLSLCVAILQSMWHKSGNEAWLKATRFFGKLLLINFALGVATGIVQEFQFGMNWSEYSRFVGDIFGAPLAIEALLAFFLESTFLGLWIFGWGRLSKGAHLAMIWLFTAGVNLSALWILTANSWMQHPVGAVYNPATGRSELHGVGGFFELLGNPVLWVEFSHVITSAWLLAGTFIAGIAIWWMTRAAREGSNAGQTEAKNIWRPIAIFGMWAMIIGGLGTIVSGHIQGQEMVKYQPAKMAAAEMICVDTDSAAFTVAAFGECPLNGEGSDPVRFIEIPGLASFLATDNINAHTEGVQGVQDRMVDLLNSNEDFVAQYGDAAQYSYVPPQAVSFWTFRLMILTGAFSVLLGIWGIIAMSKGKTPKSKALGTFAIWSVGAPFLGVSFGWIFTEMGRQPWVVHPNLEGLQNGEPIGSVLMMTQLGVSTAVPPVQILLSMIIFTVLYAVLGVIWFILMRRYTLEGMYRGEELHGVEAGTDHDGDSDTSLSFGY